MQSWASIWFSSWKSLWHILQHYGVFVMIIGLMTHFFLALRYRLSGFFPVNSGVRQSCVLARIFFNTCLLILNRVINQSHCGACISNTRVIHLISSYDEIIFKQLGVLETVLEVIDLQSFLQKKKVKIFENFSDAIVQSVWVGLARTWRSLKFHLSWYCSTKQRHTMSRSLPVNLAYDVVKLIMSVWCCYLQRRTKIQTSQELMLPILSYGSETWKLNITWRNEVMPLVIIAFAKSWCIAGMAGKTLITRWNWIQTYTLQFSNISSGYMSMWHYPEIIPPPTLFFLQYTFRCERDQEFTNKACCLSKSVGCHDIVKMERGLKGTLLDGVIVWARQNISIVWLHWHIDCFDMCFLVSSWCNNFFLDWWWCCIYLFTFMFPIPVSL